MLQHLLNLAAEQWTDTKTRIHNYKNW
jgi:hypothetical protein